MRTHKILGIFSLSFAALLSAYIVFAANPFDIAFPVEELGNCVNQSQCKAYCDRAENFKACSEFAANHGFKTRAEQSAVDGRIDKLTGILESGGGPGGCKTESECRVYCEDTANIETCIEFAENHNLLPSDELGQAKKIAKAINSGAKLPGNCRNRQACESYCSQSNHSDECLAFAEQSGVLPKEEIGIAKKAQELMSKGESPGGCQSKESCQAFCSDSSHRQECFDFGVKAGFIKSDQASEFRRFAQEGGPGGCKTKEACETFCNDQANQETCLNFAKDHGFIKEDDAQRMKESVGHMRIGLENVPPEVEECLKANLGENVIKDIKAGTLMPGPDIGNRMRSCFETHMGRVASPKEAFEHMPPEALKCVEEKLGADFEKIRSGESVPAPEMGEKMRACFESMPHSQMPKLDEILKNAPPEAQACLKDVFGSDFENLSSGNRELNSDLKDKIRSCFGKIISSQGERGDGFMPMKNRQGGFKQGVMGSGTMSGVTGDGMTRFGGPGGCRTPEECMNYCAGHGEECMKFRPEGAGGMMRQGQEGMMDRGGMIGGERQGIRPPISGSGYGEPAECPIEECGKEPGSAVCEQKVKELIAGNPGERFKYAGCFRGNMTPPQPLPIKSGMCPKMPTVNSCPEGQIKYQIFNSPECGAYYGCKQAGITEQSSGSAQTITTCPAFVAPSACKENISSDICRQEIQKLAGANPNCGYEKFLQYPHQYQGTYPYPSVYPTQ